MSLAQIKGTNHGAKTLVRVRPRGFCAGVVRAVDIVELALEAYGRPVYVHHEIVHNRYVVDQLRRRGAIFVESIGEVPTGAVLVFSAHGVPPRVRTEAQERELQVIDATCPLVTKVHLEALKFAREGRTLILIGHRDHQEIVGTSGEAPEQTVIVGSVEEVDATPGARSCAARFSNADDAFALRYAGNCGAAASALSVDCWTCVGRYLLRHAEPPGSGGSAHARSGIDSRGRVRRTARIRIAWWKWRSARALRRD